MMSPGIYEKIPVPPHIGHITSGSSFPKRLKLREELLPHATNRQQAIIQRNNFVFIRNLFRGLIYRKFIEIGSINVFQCEDVCLTLFHLQHQALEVFTLGMVYVDGVVGGLVELVEDADVAAALGGCGEDG